MVGGAPHQQSEAFILVAHNIALSAPHQIDISLGSRTDATYDPLGSLGTIGLNLYTDQALANIYEFHNII